MAVFNAFRVIPEYCFNCYKVFIEPRTVVELMKLMMIFEQIRLKDDNTRKCIVELREQVPGAYKGFVYCRGLEEGKLLQRVFRQVVSAQVSDKIPVTLKRGCTEYGHAYPDYPKVEDNGVTMTYREEWRSIEQNADRSMPLGISGAIIETHNAPTYTPQDARIMFAFLSYAAMIGDKSYLKISDRPLPTTSNVKRPYPFHPPVDD
jgi:hypothetical protein